MRHISRQSMSALLAGGAMVALAAAPASAQTAPAVTPAIGNQPTDRGAGDSRGVEDIVVTATRREERLQSVPVAVTALTSAALEAQQVVDVRTVERVAPNVQISSASGDSSTAKISIRGPIGTDTLITLDTSVGIFLDGVYIARAPGANLNFLDVERVEVLRGPQGTLFGRNTLSGAVSIVTKKPTDKFEGMIGLTAGNYDTFNAEGVLNLPLGEGAALRIAAQHQEHGGYAKSTQNDSKFESLNSDFIRAQLRLEPADGLEIEIAGDYNKSKQGPQWITLYSANATGRAAVARLSNNTDNIDRYVDPFARTIASTSTSILRNEVRGLSGTITGDLGGLTVKSITSYRDFKQTGGFVDLDSMPYAIQFQLSKAIDMWQASQEVQLFGKLFDDRVDFILGAYAFKEAGSENLVTTSQTDGSVKNKSQAIYGQVKVAITDKLTLAAGVRQAWDQRSLEYRSAVINAAGVKTACRLSGATLPTCAFDLPQRNWSFLPFELSANYKFTPGIMGYAKFARGVRAGGFNLRGSTIFTITGFDPEFMDSYEAGMKADFNRWLRLNVTGYYNKYKGQVLSRLSLDPNTNSFQSLNANAGDARIYGIEMEGTAVFGDLTLSAALGTADAKYTSIASGVTTVNLNSPLVLTSKYTSNLSADYDVEIGRSRFTFHVDGTRRGKTYLSNPLPPAVQIVQKPYNLVNASVKWEPVDSVFGLTLWVRNAFDKRYLTRGTDLTVAGFTTGAPGDPRTFGLTARMSF